MKKNMSKVWLVGLVIAMVASFMVGCGNNTDADVVSSAVVEDVVSSAVVDDATSSAAVEEEASSAAEEVVSSSVAESAAPVAKTVTVAVVTADGSEEEFVLNTDAEFLRGALEEEDLIVGNESEFGLFVTEVNGVKADDSKQEWWCFTKSGEMLMTGVDSTPIADGDHFEITLTVGY